VDIEMKHADVPKARIEGFDSGWWILLDYDIVVIHVFQEEAREFYELESLWADAKDVTQQFAAAFEGSGREPSADPEPSSD
jgi:ribosomal silencing factor RsfS